MAPLPVDPSGGDDRDCARLGAGGMTEIVPGLVRAGRPRSQEAIIVRAGRPRSQEAFIP